MIISNIKLVNWKNFQHVDVNLVNRVFVVGANASWKSNFLDVIRFLRDIVKQSWWLQTAVAQRWWVSKIRSLAARKVSYISIQVELSETEKSLKPSWVYFISFEHTWWGIRLNQASIIEEKVTNLAWKVIIHRKKWDKKEDTETLKFTYLEQPNSNQDFRDVYHFFQEIQYLHIVPQLIRDAESYMLAANKEDFYWRNLLDRIWKTNKKTRDSYFKKINQVLLLAVPQLKNIEYIKDKNGIAHLEAKYDHWRWKWAKQQESEFSDGTLRLIGFLWALLDWQETILLEEPELYLHSEIVKQLPEFIYNLQKKRSWKIRQVIISTHSYDILNNEWIWWDETLVLQTTKEWTEICQAKNLEEVKKYIEAWFTIAESVIPFVAPKNIQQILQLEI